LSADHFDDLRDNGIPKAGETSGARRILTDDRARRLPVELRAGRGWPAMTVQSAG
jgi:hypothetical protein